MKSKEMTIELLCVCIDIETNPIAVVRYMYMHIHTCNWRVCDLAVNISGGVNLRFQTGSNCYLCQSKLTHLTDYATEEARLIRIHSEVQIFFMLLQWGYFLYQIYFPVCVVPC